MGSIFCLSTSTEAQIFSLRSILVFGTSILLRTISKADFHSSDRSYLLQYHFFLRFTAQDKSFGLIAIPKSQPIICDGSILLMLMSLLLFSLIWSEVLPTLIVHQFINRYVSIWSVKLSYLTKHDLP